MSGNSTDLGPQSFRGPTRPCGRRRSEVAAVGTSATAAARKPTVSRAPRSRAYTPRASTRRTSPERCRCSRAERSRPAARAIAGGDGSVEGQPRERRRDRSRGVSSMSATLHPNPTEGVESASTNHTPGCATISSRAHPECPDAARCCLACSSCSQCCCAVAGRPRNPHPRGSTPPRPGHRGPSPRRPLRPRPPRQRPARTPPTDGDQPVQTRTARPQRLRQPGNDHAERQHRLSLRRLRRPARALRQASAGQRFRVASRPTATSTGATRWSWRQVARASLACTSDSVMGRAGRDRRCSRTAVRRLGPLPRASPAPAPSPGLRCRTSGGRGTCSPVPSCAPAEVTRGERRAPRKATHTPGAAMG